MTNTRKRRQGLKANYGGATPEQVAKALHAYKPQRDKLKPAAEQTQ
jgi:hypothetical protein